MITAPLPAAVSTGHADTQAVRSASCLDQHCPETEYDITRWITVSEGIENTALRSEVGNIPGVETDTATDLDEALELASQ